jgi:alpha-N-acetylglucosaminidase
MKIKLLLALLLFMFFYSNGHAQETITIKQLINQLIPGHSESFELQVISPPQGKSIFEIYSLDGKIILAGNSNNEIAIAFNWYMKYYCNSNVSSCGNRLTLPELLPLPKDTLTILFPFQRGAPEGMGAVPTMCDLLYKMAWSKHVPNNDKWIIDYQINRYGDRDVYAAEAWHILGQTIYSCDTLQEGCIESVFSARPSLNLTNAPTIGTPKRYYNPTALAKALELLLKSSEKLCVSDAYNYDVTDITRQVLANYARVKLEKVRMAFEQKDLAKFRVVTNEFLDLMRDQDLLLSTRKEFLLGPWIEAARSKGTNKEERKLFERNARSQITIWGNHGSSETGGLHDYANKEWSGLISDFYLPRWEMYFKELARQIIGTPSTKIDYYTWEGQWIRLQNNYPTKSKGNSVEVANLLFKKYKQLVIR